MVKFLFEYFSAAVICLTILTQVIIPVFVAKLKFWWFFQKEPYKLEEGETIPAPPADDIMVRIHKTKQEADDLRSVAAEKLKESESVKKAADTI